MKNFLDKRNLLQLIKNPLVSGSMILFIGNSLASFGGYLYHLILGRMLGPVDYGLLASLISLTYLLGIPITTFNLVIVRQMSFLKGRKEHEVINFFYYWLNKKAIFFTIIILIFFLILTPWLVSFLHLTSVWPLLLIMASVLISIFLTINTSVLQSYLRFGWMSIVGILQMAAKIGVAVVLVSKGWQVLGATLSFPLSFFFGLILSMFVVSRLLGKKEQKEEKIFTKDLVGYAVPVFCSTLAFTSLYTTDVVLARHFLSAREAGFYSALANLGKIIFFATAPIITVMFPMATEKEANGKKATRLFSFSLGLVFLICLGISGAYWFFPKLMVGLLFGSQYLPASSSLWLFAIFLSLYSLANLVVYYFLSLKKVKIVAFPVLAAISQIIAILFFHQNLRQIVVVSVITLSLLFLSLLFCLIYNGKKK